MVLLASHRLRSIISGSLTSNQTAVRAVLGNKLVSTLHVSAIAGSGARTLDIKYWNIEPESGRKIGASPVLAHTQVTDVSFGAGPLLEIVAFLASVASPVSDVVLVEITMTGTGVGWTFDLTMDDREE